MKVTGQKLSIFIPIRGNSNHRCEPRHDRLTLVDKRKLEAERKVERAIEYQEMLDQNGWTRAELARYLGVSRAWVSTVLRMT